MDPTPENIVVPGGGGATALAPIVAWSTGLFGCLEDRGNCFLTCFCPCITFGLVAEIVDRGATSSGASAALYALISMLTGCQLQCLYSCFYRTKMRAQYGLEESPCCDCCVHWLFESCALCQEYRELRSRGYIMDIGWHANMEQHTRTTATMPPHMYPNGMIR